MKKNPYISGDNQSRGQDWTLTEGIIVDFEETENYILYQVETDYNDLIWCKQMLPSGGSDNGFIIPLHSNDRVVVGFTNNNPENNIFILGCVQTPARKLEDLTDSIKSRLADYEKKLTDIVFTSNTDESYILNIKKNIHMIAANTFNLIGNKFNLLSSDNMVIKSDKEVLIEGTTKSTLKSPETSVEGTTKAIVKAPLVEIGIGPNQSAVLGENLYTLLTTLISSLPSVSLVPNPAYATIITTLNAQLALIKSATVKVSP
jgi:phage baseplate assembly protein gpV